MRTLAPYLLAWRTTALRDREVVDAIVHPAHAGPSAELARALGEWNGPRYWSDETKHRHLILIRPTGWRRRERWGRHLLLLFLTLGTTLFSGAFFAGRLPAFVPWLPYPADWWRALPAGWTYAIPLLVILLAHELGHYVTARRYAVDASPPYFIPWPFWPFFIGTLGAFIRLRAPIADRRQLLDIGAAGPLAGFAVALPVLVIGLLLSRPIDQATGVAHLVLNVGGPPLILGHSLMTWAITAVVHPGAGLVMLHPAAFAGWIGVIVTMLNLLPIGQLDGGHILYAAAPRVQRTVAVVLWVMLLLLSLQWIGWGVWAALVLAASRGRLGHAPVVDGYRPIPRTRLATAIACALLFAVTFTPVPFGL